LTNNAEFPNSVTQPPSPSPSPLPPPQHGLVSRLYRPFAFLFYWPASDPSLFLLFDLFYCPVPDLSLFILFYLFTVLFLICLSFSYFIFFTVLFLICLSFCYFLYVCSSCLLHNFFLTSFSRLFFEIFYEGLDPNFLYSRVRIWINSFILRRKI
jgi:hypothetical protein